jgi:tRNA dimethylallyltransferase
MAKKQARNKLMVVLGPTASGKSDLAVKLAQKFNGEIISADSRQVYKEMDIGTGKITKKEMRGIKHYLLDVASPKRQFTVAQYRKLALEAIDKIYRKHKIPIICGGTGFYVQAVAEGLIIPRVKPDWKLRGELEAQDTEELFKELRKLDPRRAKNIDARNRRRLIRALEIIKKTGKPIPVLEKKSQFDALYLGTKKSQEELKELIKRRLLHRIKQGMIAEVRKLKNPPAGGQGLSWKRLNDFGLEYRYIAKHLQGELTQQEMIDRLQKEIEHYAKRQMTWFKKNKRIHWIETYKPAETLVREFLKK